MPCYSSITKTKFTNAQRLQEALKATGWMIVAANTLEIHAKQPNGASITFIRGTEGQSFNMSSGNAMSLPIIGKKYAELGVKAWAQKSGYFTQKNDGKTIVLVRG